LSEKEDTDLEPECEKGVVEKQFLEEDRRVEVGSLHNFND
tara:strand:- start:2420 stop:2539 length:120 start_codon:yes stop_codon:yes gene_type:complete